MDKKTLLAIVLSVVVISVGFIVPRLIWPPEKQTETTQTQQPAATPEASATGQTTTGEAAGTGTTAAGESSTTGQLSSGVPGKVTPFPVEGETNGSSTFLC